MLRGISRGLNRMLGFTMIELLVVIAIIGVLAVAVLSAINPIEQINKGRDTRTRSDAAELLSATERYFTTQEQYPWNSDNVGVAPFTARPATATVEEVYNSDGDLEWLEVLQDSNEVKSAFAQRIFNNYNTVVQPDNVFVVLKALNSDEVRTCFLPTSKQFKLEAVRKCCAATATANKCGDAASASLKGSTPLAVAGFTLCANDQGDDSVSTDEFFICLP